MARNDRDLRDDDLRSRFAALRREEEGRVPQFKTRRSNATAPAWRLGGLVAVTACLVATIVCVSLLQRTHPQMVRVRNRPAVSLTQWNAPTDFLLETPGRELLRTVPAIGVAYGYSKAPGPRRQRSTN